jgi:glycosyltransferase involved in cell wall biosynthesis
MAREMEDAGASVRLLGLKRDLKGKNFNKMPALALALRKTFETEKPYFFHVQYLAPGALPVLWAKISRMPRVLATLHTPGHVYGKRLFLLKFIATYLCDAFLCVSEAAESAIFGDSEVFSEELLRKGRKHFSIFNGVDCVEIKRIVRNVDQQAFRKSLGLSEEPVIGVVGRLNPVKGHAFLLNSFAHLVRTQPKVRLLIVGDGESRENLLSQACALGISGNIIWTGRVSLIEAIKFYAAMDVVAVPSLFEGFGLSAAEAMAAGKPVVASNVDGLCDLMVDQKTGFLVTYGDEKSMAGALLKLLINPDLSQKMGMEGSRHVFSRFDLNEFKAKWLELYHALEN